MGTSWAVGAAAALGVLVAAASEGAGFLVAVALGLLVAAWAYGIAMGVYGSKGALAGLLGNVLLGGALLQGVLPLASCAPADACSLSRLFLAPLSILVSLLAAWAIAAELRARRGPVQWGTALFLMAPLVPLAIVVLS